MDEPNTEKFNQEGSGNGLYYGLGSMQGWRKQMEDTHCAIIGLPHDLKDWSFFGIFDGHTGSRVSEHCAQNLIKTIIETENFNNCVNCSIEEQVQLVKKSIYDGFLILDEEIKNLLESAKDEEDSGSTAVCVMISPTHIFFANCGDCRCVMSRNKKCFFTTSDHKPENPSEKERIEKAGGNVKNDRVLGYLAVSRAFGDYMYKKVEGKSACEQLVTAEAEITAYERSDEEEFIVLASDGIWDVLCNEDLCNYIRHMLLVTSDIKSICNSILDACLYEGSEDDMTVAIVVFSGANKISESAIQKDREINESLEQRVKEILEHRQDIELHEVMRILVDDDIDGLPPGVGLLSKISFLEDLWKNLNNKLIPPEKTMPVNVKHQKKKVIEKLVQKFLYFSCSHDSKNELLNVKGLLEWVTSNNLVSCIPKLIWQNQFETIAGGGRNTINFEKFISSLVVPISKTEGLNRNNILFNLAMLPFTNLPYHFPLNSHFKDSLTDWLEKKKPKLKMQDFVFLVKFDEENTQELPTIDLPEKAMQDVPSEKSSKAKPAVTKRN